MRLLPLTLLVVCCSASAEWVKIAEKDSNVFFVDFETLRIDGNIRKILALVNLGDGYSMTGYEEHDCANDRLRTVHVNFHTEHFGGGVNVGAYVNPIDPWRQVSSMSAEETAHISICKK
jgi:hypothetical protein